MRAKLKSTGHQKKTTALLAFFFAAYLVFIIYGSLVPFKFNHRTLSDAWSMFIKFQFASIDSISRIDWATNIMLGIPASFLGMAVFYRLRGFTVHIVVVCLVFLTCLLTSVTAEFLQLFFSSRIPSMNDIVAQSFGEGIGIVTWLLFGKNTISAFTDFMAMDSFSSKLKFIFWGYIFILFLYNLMPLDLSLNPTDIYHKWKTGHINLIPFGFHVESLSQLTYNTIVDLLTWFPVAFFLVRYENRSIVFATFMVCMIALLIESIQVLVVSRITDVTDLITALAGGLMGSFTGLAGKNKNRSKEKANNIQSFTTKKDDMLLKQTLKSLVLFMIWTGVILCIYWFPFNFEMNKHLIREQLHNISLIPFNHYQNNGIYNSITQAFRKVIFFVPSGIILSYYIRGGTLFPRNLTSVIIFLWFSATLGIAGLIECGQFFLPHRIPDLTDILLESVGAAAGFLFSKPFYPLRKKSAT